MCFVDIQEMIPNKVDVIDEVKLSTAKDGTECGEAIHDVRARPDPEPSQLKQAPSPSGTTSSRRAICLG